MRRRLIGPIACALSLVTGAWFGQAYTLFTPLDPISAADRNVVAAEAAVWRFYDAVDTLLRTSDDADLLAAVGSDFVDHAVWPGLPPTRDGLVRYLATLPETFPDLRLTPGGLLVQDDRVVAQVRLDGVATGSFLGIPSAGSLPWTSVDIFRVSGGQIVEHWADAQGRVVAETLVSTTLSLPAGPDHVPSLERVTIAPDATDSRYRRGPAVILAETVAVDVTLDNALISLAVGEVVVVPTGVSFAVNNRSDASANIVVLRLMAPVWPATYVSGSQPDPEPLPAGVTTQLLVTGPSGTVEPGPHTVAFGRIALAPGADLAKHRTVGAELVAVAEGTLTAMFPGDTTRYWIYPSNLSGPPPENLENLSPTSGLSVAPNVVATYRNDEATMLSLLVVTILPSMPRAGGGPAMQPAGP